jgi:2-oxoglutarate dehydrogenase complex dehydrogenase (E1) component-like enzyme
LTYHIRQQEQKENQYQLANPSHLETVGSIIEGITSLFKQDRYFPMIFLKSTPIAVHMQMLLLQGTSEYS